MSSPMMTRILGFACWACAMPPRNTVRTAASESMSTAILPSIVVFTRDSSCDLMWDVLSATTAESGDVRRGRIRKLLDRFQIFFDHLERGSGGPPEERADDKILVGVVVVWVRLIGSRITFPHLPVAGSTRFGTFPAAIRSPRGFPEIDSPLMNRAAANVEATVVNSLTVTAFGKRFPTTPSTRWQGCLRSPWRPRVGHPWPPDTGRHPCRARPLR